MAHRSGLGPEIEIHRPAMPSAVVYIRQSDCADHSLKSAGWSRCRVIFHSRFGIACRKSIRVSRHFESRLQEDGAPEVCYRTVHDRLSTGRSLYGGRDIIVGKVFVLQAGRIFLVNIVIVEGSWPSQCGTKVVVQTVSAPKGPSSALSFCLAHRPAVHVAVSMKSDGKTESGHGTEKTPTVVNSRLGEEPQALAQPCLDTGEANSSVLLGESMIGGEEVADTTNNHVLIPTQLRNDKLVHLPHVGFHA